MRKKILLPSAGAALALRLVTVLAALTSALPATGFAEPRAGALTFAGSPITMDGLRLPARVVGPSVSLAVDGSFQPRFWSGVNLGSTVPGRQPGEVAATRTNYDSWLAGMGALGVHLVRVYTILRPDFYDALLAYDRAHPDAPIYLIQGVWIPEDQFIQTQNAYDPQVTDGFKSELHDAVGVVHGDIDLPQRPGHAGGSFRSDVSPWLLAWSIGVEWDPFATAATDQKNAGVPPFHGAYFEASSNATPMESWIASMLDYVAGLEAARGWSRPMTFTNWVTTDPLHHPYEPLAQEDMVSIDATHISATLAWPGGFFASYHAYPYYPDFLRWTPEYQNYRRARDGQLDPYAGYLHDLRAYHGKQAVMITEFGVPSSLGQAHLGPDGRDQGNLSEQQAASLDAAMLRDIHDEGFAGGVLFEWIDEWFKFTWNTIDYALPADRRQLWFNALTNEEHFGVVAADPGRTQIVTLDGNAGEWSHNGSSLLARSTGPVREVRAAKDEEYMYLLVRVAHSSAWQHGRVTIGFHVLNGNNRGLPGMPGVDPEANVAVTVGPGPRTQIAQAAWADPIGSQYGMHLHMIPVQPADLVVGSGAWVRPRLILNRPYTIPATGVQRPVEIQDLGTLPWGTSDPHSKKFDERHLVDARGDVIELRIPWELLTFADPSSRVALVPHADGTFTTQPVSRVGIAVATDAHHLLNTPGFTWKTWNAVQWHERRKAGWNILATAVAALNG